ncbi:hypothetical protein BO82DRAFT_359897 [Aspergillus uvarum CBS 121591]|uniref:Conidiation-specific protein 8 n=1 Tax=Aspergillus uvarum CBS 121591 TaxID=1448315 RepID=A0A319BSS8_9EURO|nr:hypothetical protein BO82DRAFT_359897 [Aspergillus uvarum CBS 121591]PYH75594.1 hypothetical protein BO82DRAFT_359897 [Aspergillus uvarum CBS 121591]
MSSNSNNMASSPPRAPDRRRSSGQNSSLFEGLTSQKRNSDPNFASRRDSYTEQAQTGGMFARWWDGYTRGSNQGK